MMPCETPHDLLAPLDSLRDWYEHAILGNRVDNYNSLFEVMGLQVFQTGLTWKMLLAKRDGFREAFSSWEIDAVAAMGPGDVEALRQNTGVTRNGLKIQATIENARTVQKLQAENGSFCTWFYDILPGTTYLPCRENCKELLASWALNFRLCG